MLGKNFSRIKYLLFLALFLVVPVKSWAGFVPGFFDTDGVNAQMVGFWDLRTRNSFVQVTNTSPLPITVHIQIFNAGANCSEVDFYDTYTGNDTHVYDLRNALIRNNGTPLSIALPDGGFGVVVVTNVDGVNGPALGESLDDFVLTGNFRVIDNAGYEYRSNMDGTINALTDVGGGDLSTFNFNNVNGNNASDVVGIILANTGPGFIEVIASGTSITFDVDLYDAAENVISCDDFTFSCSPTAFDIGINDALPNSRIDTRLCPGNFDSVGLVKFAFEAAVGDYLTGFIGLNNGDGTGSMDTWWIGLQSILLVNDMASGLGN